MKAKISFPTEITSIDHGGTTFPIIDGILEIPDNTDQRTVNVLMGMAGIVLKSGKVSILEGTPVTEALPELPPTPELITNERAELINQLTVAGAKVDRRWGIVTLRAKVAAL